MRRILAVLPLLLVTATAYSQKADTARADSIARRAVARMEAGHIDESIVLLDSALRIAPRNVSYHYEKGIAFFLKKDFARALQEVKPWLADPRADELMYRLVGDLYTAQSLRDSAAAIYRRGLKRFPRSGGLYLGLGILRGLEEDFSGAIEEYERGMIAEPTFAPNYYRAAELFFASDEPIWGILYGEIFVNLERTSERTGGVGQLIFDAYRRSIDITADSSFGVHLSLRAKLTVRGDSTMPTPDLARIEGAYELAIAQALLLADSCRLGITNLGCLMQLRRLLVGNWFGLHYDKRFPNALFSYQKLLLDLGMFDAYNAWLFGRSDPNGYADWVENHEPEMDRFLQFIAVNRLQIETGPLVRPAPRSDK